MKFSAIKMIMKQQLVTNNVLEEDRITLKISNSPEKAEARAETSLARRDYGPQQRFSATMDFSSNSNNSTCANSTTTTTTNTTTATTTNPSDCRESSREHPAASSCASGANLMQRMYIMTRHARAGEGDSTNGQSYAKAASRGALTRFAKRSKASYNTSKGLFKPALVCLVAMLTLSPSCLLAPALASEGPTSTADGGEILKHPNERSDSAASSKSVESAASSSSSSSSSSEKSIVASLSSAVASAAAAAAVAAAQNSLSSSDARSLVSNSLNRHHNQAQRTAGMNLAYKLVDTIPEVPYNILHNMKKLDHAAPFYNVPNKLSASTTKESTQNFLTNALQASGSFGGAAEQLSALFRSPLWKRIADGYGEFTSEFRSRFRAPGAAAPMKGPTSSTTTKLMRDITVPALLMLLASTVSGGDWRPVRTRRKSFAPVDIAAALPNGPNQALQSIVDLKPTQFYQSADQFQQQQTKPNMDLMMGESAAASSWQQGQQQQQQVQPMQQSDPSQAIRANNLASIQPTLMDGANPWMASQVNGNSPPPQSLAASDAGQDQNQLYYNYQPAASAASIQQQQMQPVKRSDEIITPESGHAGQLKSATAIGQERANLFSALTSELAVGQAKLMSKLFNANVNGDGNSYRMTSLADGFNKLSPTRRNLLSDKQRYSLVDSSGAAPNEPKSSSSKASLSAVAHALASLLSAQPSSSSSESGSSSSSPLASGKPSFFARANLQQLIGEPTINHEDAFARRQPQQRDSSQAEQRDLTKLLPETWREVVKRTMSTVQQQANVQWKSIEGQLANWVQDKLKTAASSASASPSSASSSASASPASGGLGSNAPPAPVANMLASISSSALNILGLHKNTNNSSTHSHSTTELHNAAKVAEKSAPSSGGSETAASLNQRGKLEKKQSSGEQQQPARGALASVANVLVKSLTSRQSSPSSSSSSSSSTSTTTTPSSPLLPRPTPPNAAPANQTPTLTTNDASPLSHKAQPPTADDTVASSASSGIVSRYPTLTGAQPESEKSEPQAGSSSGSVATAANQVNVNNAND